MDIEACFFEDHGSIKFVQSKGLLSNTEENQIIAISRCIALSVGTGENGLHNPALFIFLPLSFVQTPRWFAS
jgi:hypothetical protein